MGLFANLVIVFLVHLYKSSLADRQNYWQACHFSLTAKLGQCGQIKCSQGFTLTKEASPVPGLAHVEPNGLVLIELPPGGGVTALAYRVLVSMVIVHILPCQDRRPVESEEDIFYSHTLNSSSLHAVLPGFSLLERHCTPLL